MDLLYGEYCTKSKKTFLPEFSECNCHSIISGLSEKVGKQRHKMGRDEDERVIRLSEKKRQEKKDPIKGGPPTPTEYRNQYHLIVFSTGSHKSVLM